MSVSKKLVWGASSHVGYSRTINEDGVFCKDLSEDTSLFIIADGEGSLSSSLQPAYLAIYEIEEMIQRLWDEDSEFLLSNVSILLRESVMVANKVIGAFSKANQEKYAGFSASLSVCLLHKNELHFVHTGNTRIYLIRKHPQDGFPNIMKLTRDHTKATVLLDDGIITEFQYYSHPGKLSLTSSIGVFTDPELQQFDITLRPEDILLMTTDGIHYALQPDPMAQLIMESDNCDTAVNALIQASIMEKYIDNMSAIMIYLLPDE